MRLTPIELMHGVLFNPSKTVFNCTALLVTYYVRVDSQRDPWIAVPQLLLRNSQGDPPRWYAQLLKQPVQNLCPEFVGLWAATAVE